MAFNFIRYYQVFIVLLIFENVFYLERNFLSCFIFYLNFTYLNTVPYPSLFFLENFPGKIWNVWKVVH